MRQLVAAIACIGILISCNSSDKTKATKTPIETSKTTADSTAPEAIKPLVAIDTDEALLATALMAAPRDSRDSCKVIGFNMAGDFITFREGTNEFIVLADDPKKPGFNAACYHKSLGPFMARGRALRAEGKKAAEIFDIREAEAKSGKLDMGTPGATLHIYFGPHTMYDTETNKVDGAKYRYVVYLPFATAATTGLPEKPVSANHPWIMNPGTHRAHIMISPLVKD